MTVVLIPPQIMAELEGRPLERAVEAWLALTKAADELGDGRTFLATADVICSYNPHISRNVFYRAVKDLKELRLLEITSVPRQDGRNGPRQYDIMRYDLNE